MMMMMMMIDGGSEELAFYYDSTTHKSQWLQPVVRPGLFGKRAVMLGTRMRAHTCTRGVHAHACIRTLDRPSLRWVPE